MTDAATIAQETADRLTQQFEGFSATAYQDPAGVWTIAFGSTRDVDGNPVTASTPPVTREQGLELLKRDLLSAIATVEADVDVPLTADEESALSDFVYNVGAGQFEASTLLRLLDAGDLSGAAGQFARWDMAGGRVLAGLVRRRTAERALFLGQSSSNP